MTTYGKVWGKTAPVFAGNNVAVHRIEARSGMQCSKHVHRHKCNLFFVERGCLRVTVWKNAYALADVTQLQAGESTIVPPGEYHRFRAISDVVAYEVYWTELDPQDIERDDVGGEAKEGESDGD